MSPASHEYFKGVIDYLRSIPSLQSHDEVIADCAAKGYSPTHIMVGLTFVRGVPYRDTKGMVMSHPVWGSRRQEWDKFHDALEAMMDKEE